MRNLLKTATIFLFLITLTAGTTAPAKDNNKAKALLDKVVSKAKSYKNIVIDFKYSIYNAKEKINQDSNGNVAMEGNKYVLNFMGITKIYDGKKIYTIVPEDEEVTVTNNDESDKNAITPNKIFTFFKKGFKYSMDIKQTIPGKTIQYVKLTPSSVTDTRKEILIGIDTKTNHIYNLIETGKNGTKTTLTVSTFKFNQALAKNHFTFVKSKYPNYYINKAD
ncbi:Outer membrane lipoprotein-sorting protein [Flavobacterium urocaniciphilum]|uniref:Outer membrane lipoprotein-sorting protein n=2 Tax=Flavobacterium urocaniciphilum TaxID=1299341 RepID=A0A1H8ZKR9_9FLAO|nr:Outer membrane lipoprotein-sorting protein [Flavobacterium urocaniciphilum]